MWIKAPGATGRERNHYWYFRKRLSPSDLAGGGVSPSLRKAQLRISAQNSYKLYINGKALSHGMNPAPSVLPQEKYALSYDISDCLKPGENVLAVLLTYLGGSGQNYRNGFPALWAKLELEWDSGEKQSLVSDASWRVSGAGPYEHALPFHQARRLSASTCVHLPADAWTEADYEDGDDSGVWQAALPLSEAEAAELVRAGEALEQPIPEMRVMERFKPRRVSVFPGGEVFDCGHIVTGWAELAFETDGQARLRFRYGEALDAAGRVSPFCANEPAPNYVDSCVVATAGSYTWASDLSAKAFRYVEWEALPASGVRVQTLRVVRAGNVPERCGDFRADQADLNTIYAACIRTQENALLNGICDCPQREQAQYLADAYLQADLLLTNYDGAAFVAKLLQDFAHDQRADGSFPFVSPGSTGQGDFHIHIPEWDLHYPALLWKLIVRTQEPGFYARFRPACEALLARYMRLSDKGKRLIRFADEAGAWHIPDWPDPAFRPGLDQNGRAIAAEESALAAEHLFLYRAIGACMAMEAAIRGETRDELAEFRKNLADRIFRAFYIPEQRRFRDQIGSETTTLGTQVLALSLGLMDSRGSAGLMAELGDPGHETSVLMTHLRMEVLARTQGPAALLPFFLRRAYPSWLAMAESWGTMWEGFHDENSHSHAWNAFAAFDMQTLLVGLIPPRSYPGTWIFRPRRLAAGGPRSFRSRVWTPEGVLTAAWREGPESELLYQLRKPRSLKLKLDLPPGAQEVKIL